MLSWENSGMWMIGWLDTLINVNTKMSEEKMFLPIDNQRQGRSPPLGLDLVVARARGPARHAPAHADNYVPLPRIMPRGGVSP